MKNNDTSGIKGFEGVRMETGIEWLRMAWNAATKEEKKAFIKEVVDNPSAYDETHPDLFKDVKISGND